MTPLSFFSVNLLSEHLLLFMSVLIFSALLVMKVGSKFGVPSLLLFLIMGMVAGADGLGAHPKNNIYQDNVLRLAKNSLEYLKTR